MNNYIKKTINNITKKCITVLAILSFLFAISCNDSTSSDGGQSGGNPPDPHLIFEAYLKASNTDAEDEFGYSVALSDDGSTLAVGAQREDGSGSGVDPTENNNADGAGAVYVYTRSGNNWDNPVYLKASNTGGGDKFGISVALSFDGNTLAVGARYEDGSGSGINLADNNDIQNAGAVYVYSRSSSTWRQTAYLKASNPGAGDKFGISVALSDDGNTLAVGASNEDGNGSGINPADNNDAAAAGAVYVYKRSNGIWVSNPVYIKANNPSAGDLFGHSVALSGDASTLAIGAPTEDGGESGINPAQNDNGTDVGAVYIYTNSGATSGSTWGYSDYIKANNPDDEDNFGYSVALSDDGSTLAVGAQQEDSSGSGVNPEENNSTSDAGAVYIYNRTGNTWSQNAYIKANNTGTEDNFGYSIALSSDGNNLAVGAYLEDSSGRGINPADNNEAIDTGAVYVYTRTGGAWGNKPVYVKANNPDDNDWFGNSVALSGDKSTLVVGAKQEAGSETGANPDDNNDAESAGAVYVYRDF